MQKVIFTLIFCFCFCLASFAQVENKSTNTSNNESNLDELKLDPQNTLETIYVIEFKERLYSKSMGCTISSVEPFKLPIYPVEVVYTDIEENLAQLVPITLRNRPGPAEKDPGKPIKELSLYPNPSFGQIQIQLTFETLQLSLFDMLGHNLGDIPFQTLEDELVSIDLSNLPSGTYALQLRHEEGTDIQKIIIVGE